MQLSEVVMDTTRSSSIRWREIGLSCAVLGALAIAGFSRLRSHQGATSSSANLRSRLDLASISQRAESLMSSNDVACGVDLADLSHAILGLGPTAFRRRPESADSANSLVELALRNGDTSQCGAGRWLLCDAVSETLSRRISLDGDNDFVLPILLNRGVRTWARQFGDECSIDSVVRSHLAADYWRRSCYGTHWCCALADVLRSPRGLVSATVLQDLRNAASLAARELCRDIESDGRLAPLHGVELPVVDRAQAELVLQSHGLEFLLMLPVDVFHEAGLDESAIDMVGQQLLVQLDSHATNLPVAPRAHAARALRLWHARRLDSSPS